MTNRRVLKLAFVIALSIFAPALFTQTKPRARDLGVPFDGTPGPNNAITDVKGVEVGHTTLISGEGKLEIGKGPVRTGVTAVLPRGKDSMNSSVFAGWWSLNGNGEMTGTTWVEESGFLEGPVMITNTHSVGVVRDAAVETCVSKGPIGRRAVPGRFSGSARLVVETLGIARRSRGTERSPRSRRGAGGFFACCSSEQRGQRVSMSDLAASEIPRRQFCA